MPVAEGLRIRRLHLQETATAARWDAFVRARAGASFFHLSGWQRVIAESFGHATYFLYAEAEDGRVVGVLPLAHVASALFGQSLTSLPFASYGGVVADSEEAAERLEREAIDLARQLGVEYLELRQVQARKPGRPAQDLYVTFKRAIPPVLDEAMLCIPQKRRNMVRKALKLGLQVVEGDSLDNFFPAFFENAHNHGTPVLPKRYFRILMEVFGPECEIVSVHDGEGQCVSSILCLYFRDEVLAYYAGETRAARSTAANDLKYWAVMKRAAARGCTVFDLGRSKKGTGSFEFKRLWDFESQQLHYEYELVGCDSVPQKNPMNAKYTRVIEAWKRLPKPVALWLGPKLVRSLG